MKAISQVFTVSALAAVAASSLFFMGRYAMGEALGGGPTSLQAVPSSINQILGHLSAPVPNFSTSTSSNSAPGQTKARPVRVKTHVLLVSRARLDEVKVDYNLLVPMHHVRPDTAETMSGAALVDATTAGRLIQIAQSGLGNMDFYPDPEDYPEYEDEFDCLSDMFRGGKPLPEDLASSVVNGLSLAYSVSASPDRRSVVFSPVTIMRADYPAAEIPNTAAHEVPYQQKVKIAVPDGGTLLIDAGSVKANRTEGQASRHLVVLVRAELKKGEGVELAGGVGKGAGVN